MPFNLYLNWSGGKDSALALYKLRDSVGCLLTSINSVHDRVSMHGVRRDLLEEQAKAIGLELRTIELPEQPSMEAYEAAMSRKVQELMNDGYETAAFGDIFLEDLRSYREEKLKQMGMNCIFPLWKIDSAELMKEFLALGFKAIVVCVNEQMLDAGFCGRRIDEDFVRDLPEDIDVCGENGEYHSFVYDGPVFRRPVEFEKGEIVRKVYKGPEENGAAVDYGFYFCDLKKLQ